MDIHDWCFRCRTNRHSVRPKLPGGKCTPLMKRTVLLVRGAWLLLKNAPVRANPTATSLLLTCWLKFPVTVGGASGLRYSASTFPARSTTAITAVVGEVAAAAARTILSTSLVVNVAAAGVTTRGGAVFVPPPPQPASKNVSKPATPRPQQCPRPASFDACYARGARPPVSLICALAWREYSNIAPFQCSSIRSQRQPPIDDRPSPVAGRSAPRPFRYRMSPWRPKFIAPGSSLLLSRCRSRVLGLLCAGQSPMSPAPRRTRPALSSLPA